MDTNKYKVKLLNNIKKQLEDFLHREFPISNEEVYRFLHSIIGTSGTIGLTGLSNISSSLMNQLNDKNRTNWDPKELQGFLRELISISYEVENEGIPMLHSAPKKKEEAPLILVIDDDIPLLMFIKDELEKLGWVVQVMADPDKAISSLYDLNPDCVIVDVFIKDKNGFEMLELMRKSFKCQLTPKIMISVNDDKEIRKKSYEYGADDFIAKPFDIDEFIVRIKRNVERKQLINNLLLMDELTKVYNRKYLKQAFLLQLSDFKRYQESFSMAILDIDHFKKVNDQYGHLVGDIVLREFASILDEQSRSADTVIRYGGEEFLLLMPRTTVKEAYQLLERLRFIVAEKTFYADNTPFYITFSGGVVEVNVENIPLERWLEFADDSLYQAKAAGRNQIRIANEETPHMGIKNREPQQIAVVDDDPIIRAMLVDQLDRMIEKENLAAKVLAYRDGETFLSEWQENSSRNLVLLDGVMPGMDGLEVLQTLRAKPNAEKYDIIMLTYRNSEEDIAQAVRFGADDYIIKPFNMSELEARVKRFLLKMK